MSAPPLRSEKDLSMNKSDVKAASLLSPKRNTTKAESIEELVDEQMRHFSIIPDSAMGQELKKIMGHLYQAHVDVGKLWEATLKELSGLDRSDRIAAFNAKRFLCFQIAKILDGIINPMRKTYQSLITRQNTMAHKGPYPLFDNVTALFSATPVITRTATYIYACSEWIDDAFQGKELLLEIYSRLMNPTSVCLANHIVDLEAGKRASEYFAWNFNSGMAAIDGILSHVLGYQDIVLSSRNIYGGSHQLLHDWFGKSSNLDIALEWFDGTTAASFSKALKATKKKYAAQLKRGKHIYIFLESPCNPHGYALEVPDICKVAHKNNITVICDSTVGTPLLQPTLQREDPMERPDFVVHSYTKDLTGSGTTTAGVVIGRNETMFIPKHQSVTALNCQGKKQTYAWDETLFWNVYYIKGAFLDADKAFEVITGMRTLHLRVLRKCINTIVLSHILDKHPMINVKCAALKSNENHEVCKKNMSLGLPAPLFTINFEGHKGKPSPFSIDCFKRFFDSLEPVFGLQVSLGQVNTVILCPALTSHSELSPKALKEANIEMTTIRISVGDEDPRSLLAHFMRTAENTLAQERPHFLKGFPSYKEIDRLYQKTYLDVHKRFITSQPSMAAILK